MRGAEQRRARADAARSPSADPAKAWQTRADRTSEELFQLGANIFLYAVDKRNLRYKGQTYIVKDNGERKPTRTIKVARLMVGDNPDPEPGGWRRLGNVLKNDHKLALAVEPVSLGCGQLAAYKVAHLTGTAAFKLDRRRAKGTDRLRRRRRHAGRRRRRRVRRPSPRPPSRSWPRCSAPRPRRGWPARSAADHPVYTLPGAKIDRFSTAASHARSLRRAEGPAPQGHQGPRPGPHRRLLQPRRPDAGLVGQPVDGIIGYDPATATAIMRNIVLYASAGGNAASATAPTSDSKPAPSPKPPGAPAKKPDEPLPF